MAERRCRDCNRLQHFGGKCDVCGGWLDRITDDSPFDAAPPPADENERVECWRLSQLLDAGYPPEIAGPLAERPWRDVDLHQAVALLESGCSPELAGRILL